MTTAIEQTLETYGIENWGAGYFSINRKGNLVVHEYEIARDGDTVATVSKRWFALRDTYGVAIAPGENTARQP